MFHMHSAPRQRFQTVLALLLLAALLSGCGAADTTVYTQPPEATLYYGSTETSVSGSAVEWSYSEGGSSWVSSVSDTEHPLKWEFVPLILYSGSDTGSLSFPAEPDQMTITWWDTTDTALTEALDSEDYTAVEALSQTVEYREDGTFSIPAETSCRVLVEVAWERAGSRRWYGTARYVFDLKKLAASTAETATESQSVQTAEVLDSEEILTTAPDADLRYGGTAVTLTASPIDWSYTVSGDTWTGVTNDYDHTLLWEDIPVVTPTDTTGGLLQFDWQPDSIEIRWWNTNDSTAENAVKAYDYTLLETLTHTEDLNDEGWFSIPTDQPCRVEITASWTESAQRGWGGKAIYVFDLNPATQLIQR